MPIRALQALETIEGDLPAEIRGKVLRAVQDVAAGDVALFVRYGLKDGGPHYADVQGAGDPCTISTVERDLVARPCLTTDLWDPFAPRLREKNAFVRTAYEPRDLGRSPHPIFHEYYARWGVRAQVRALFYDDDRFLGWLGIWRLSKSAFSRANAAALSALVRPAVSALSAAERLDREETHTNPQILFYPHGAVARASSVGAEWLTEERRDELALAVRRADAGDLPPLLFVHGFEVRLARLDGAVGVRYLATVGLPEPITLGATAGLTARQRQVALDAAEGRSNQEIARKLGLGPETVREHMKVIYRQLGVSTRAELARALLERK